MSASVGGRRCSRAGADERQILALLGRERFRRRTHAGHPIQLFVRASNQGGADECTLPVELSHAERTELRALLSGGKQEARKLKRAQILLAADAGASDEAIAASVGVGGSTVYRTKRRFVLGNLEAALGEEPRPGADRKLGKEEALLVATACSNPPEGRARWTLELLADELVRLTEHGSLSRETVRRRWPRTTSSRGARTLVHPAGGRRVCRPHGGRTRPRRRTTRSEASGGLLRRAGPAHRRDAPADPGHAWTVRAPADCEYKRNGTANLFILLDVHRSWRRVKVTDSRAAVDYAACARELCDVHFPKAERIRVVLDNLSTHSAGALYQAFPAGEARRMLRRLEFHYTPKHASWLNMVEIEIGVLRSQCLDRRIATKARLIAEVAAWERHRNASGARIQWMFTTYKARAKMGRAYPHPNES